MRRRVLAVGCLWIGFLAGSGVATAQSYGGWLDVADCAHIGGWAWDGTQPNTPISVDLYDGSLTGPRIVTVYASAYRPDLAAAGIGNGYHAFNYATPPALKDGRTHTVVAAIGGTNIQLPAGPNVFSCPPGATGYQYYFSDPVTSINPANWTQNGVVSAGASGLTSADANGGSLISRVAVPDGSSEYEVAMTLNLTSSGGSYIAYVKASPDARLGPVTTGTFYAMELANPTVTSAACTSTLNIWKSINGSLALLAQTTVKCHNGMVFRAVGRTGTTSILVDNIFYGWTSDTSLTSGQAGIGVRGAPASNAVSLVRLGPIDRTPPSPVSAQTVKSSVYSNSVQFQWQAPPDDPNGTGVVRFDSVPSNGIPNGYSSPEIFDAPLSPSTTYNYPIYAIDAHFNYASPTTITVTTPPAGAVDPRRVGVRSTGSYWGGLGENIDLLSGNLNFTLPLLRAQGRGGWKMPINLTYNSQNWRQDPGTWNLGADVGYGYGWKLLAGSLTPYWGGYFYARYYIFTDATGAEYRLDVYNNGVWTSKDSVYVSYDSNTNRLYFNDGSFWVMGCTSAGTEADAGTMYPTLLQDSNGNQILLRYQPGVGVTWPDSSARIREIEDVRGQGNSYIGYRTYTFNYDYDPVVPHLVSITNTIGTAEAYTFNLSGLQAIAAPFDGSIQGSTQYLRSVTINGLNLTHKFETNASGELTKVTFPYGGYLRWDYTNQTYIGGRTQREVATRYLSKDGTVGAERAYVFLHDPADSGRASHWWTVLDDPDGQSEKAWWFQTDTSQFNFGLVTALEARPHHYPATAGGRHEDYTWTTDAAGNRYVAAVLTTEDMGNPAQVQKKTEQTRDVYGNVTQTKIYNYGNLTAPVRTYTNTYLTGATYSSRYIFNRLVSSTVTDGSITSTLASNYYDFGYCSSFGALAGMTNARQHDDLNYGQDFWYRGNVTKSITPAAVTCIDYNTGGVPVRTNRNGLETSSSVTLSTNYAAPSALTTNSLTETLQWNAFLGLTQATGPNGDTTALLYDAYARLAQTTTPSGAATTFAYLTAAGTTTTATTNNHWTKKTLDGFGREIRAEAGNGSTTVSQTDTEYDSCGCSPMGKMKRVSMPHAPNAAVYWTTYNYDGLGRTVSVASPDGASTKTYAYSGNTVTV